MSALFGLLVGHFVADYPLQSDFMAREKNPWSPVDPARVPPGQKPNVFWPWVLSAHSAVHAGFVAWATNNVWLGLAEFVCHWVIDFTKCAGYTDVHQDQLMHVVCKLVWWFIFFLWLS